MRAQVSFLFHLLVVIFTKDRLAIRGILFSRVVVIFDLITKLDHAVVRACIFLRRLKIHLEIQVLRLATSVIPLTLRVLIHGLLVEAQSTPASVERRLLLHKLMRLVSLLLLLDKHVLNGVHMANRTSHS